VYVQTHFTECQLTLKRYLNHLPLENQPQVPRMLLLSQCAATAEQGAKGALLIALQSAGDVSDCSVPAE